MMIDEHVVSDMIYLVRCALDAQTPDADRLDAMNMDAVFAASQAHLLSALCSLALESAGVRDERFTQARGKATRKAALMDVERGRLFSLMDSAGIWHVPLKGCVLQGLYPSYGARQMSDNDILFDESRCEEVRDIMLSLGFSCEQFGRGNHDIYHKKPVCNFELHRSLFNASHDAAVYAYYKDPYRLLVPDGPGTYGMHMTDEDFYVYLVAHEHKHFSGGGTGLRSLVDTYVFLRAKGKSLDWEDVSGKLALMGLDEFERDNRMLAEAAFSAETMTQAQEEMLAYMSNSGAYGTESHRISNQIAKYGRIGFVLHRAFPTRELMVLLYPALRRHAALLPACWAHRIAHALATKPRVIARELRITASNWDNRKN